MDLENQGRIKELNEKYGEDLVVVIGAGESEAAALAAETVTSGDPTFAGPLAGLALNVPVYHVFELKDGANEEIYEEQAGMMEMVLDMDALCESTKAFRG